MKTCSKCNETKPVESFYRNYNKCKVCVSATFRLWYADNKESVASRNLRRHQHHQGRLAEAKATGCVDAHLGGCDGGPLHFHHLVPDDKLAKVSEMNRHSDETFYAEVAKCVVVCQHHHAERHQLLEVQ